MQTQLESRNRHLVKTKRIPKKSRLKSSETSVPRDV